MTSISFGSRLPITRIVTGVFAVLALLFAAGALFMSYTLSAERNLRALSDQTSQNVGELNQLLVNLIDAETGQRGFMLTGTDSYLEPFDGRRSDIAALIARLRGSAGTRPDREQFLKRLDGLAGIITTRMDELDRTISLRRAGDTGAAMQIVQSGQGKKLMDETRAAIAGMSGGEAARLGAAQATYDRLRGQTSLGLGALFLLSVATLAFSAWLVRGATLAEAAGRHLVQVRAERDRADLISHELSHRVKNLFAVINAIITSTARGETDARRAAQKTRDRVQALSRAHALSTGTADMGNTPMKTLVSAIVEPYVPSNRALTMSGPETIIGGDRITPIGLILNELATNSLKYGAWAAPDGTVSVSWVLEAGNLASVTWSERAPSEPGQGKTDGPGRFAAPVQTGFGTTMIDLSAQQANAGITRTWKKDGLDVEISFAQGRQASGRAAR